LPPECNNGNLDERVCKLEDMNEKLQENAHNQDKINNDFHLLIADMQDKISELASRPCACQ